MSPRHRATLPRSAWQRGRQILTVGIFAAATVAGLGVGLNGASASPVTPAAAVATAVTPPPPILHHDEVARGHMDHP
jgi:hypothetical protein